jgi:hypothetical protein
MAHTTKDGCHWVPSTYKGANVYVRVLGEGSTEFYIGAGERNAGKACFKYKPTQNPQWYWGDPQLLTILPADAADGGARGGGRRSKRLRGDVSAEERAAEEEAERKIPRTAANGKLYGVAPNLNDHKERCPKCAGPLAGDGGFLGFVENTREKSVKRTYGGDSRREWSKSFECTDRSFYHVRCWDVPKTAQRSLRGLVDIAGFDVVPRDVPERVTILAKLAELHGAADAATSAE